MKVLYQDVRDLSFGFYYIPMGGLKEDFVLDYFFSSEFIRIYLSCLMFFLLLLQREEKSKS